MSHVCDNLNLISSVTNVGSDDSYANNNEKCI